MSKRKRSANPAKTRALPVLRAMIDAVDHEVLQLLSRRNGIVAEIAAYKREHGVAIRDRRRESDIIEDRRKRATSLGLNSDATESIFRLILWASRDRQASLKAEVPPAMEERTVAVIGGKGAMGRCIAEMFADLGHAIIVADLDTQFSPEEAAAVADVVIISVPIDVTVDVIRRIGPLVREDALLADVTSIKNEPVQAMLDHSKASVVGTHPLFGPALHSLQGQRVAVTPGRGDAWTDWLEGMFRARGLHVVRTTPREHDRAMAIVQVLTHYSTEVTGLTLARMGVPIEKTLEFTSPVYLMEMLMTARHFAQSPDLYASIQMSNPETAGVTAAFREAADAMHAIIDSGDQAGVAGVFEEVRGYFGSFTAEALEASSYMIDRLVERG